MATITQASFTIKTRELKRTLADINRINGKHYQNDIIDIRVLEDHIELSRPGLMRKVKATTTGRADISLPELLLEAYLKTNTHAIITFVFRNGEMECGSSIYSSSAIEFGRVSKRNDDGGLPMNPNRISVLQFGFNKTEKEIERLDLTATVKAAKRKMKSDILKAVKNLEEYGIKYDELEELVKKKILN